MERQTSLMETNTSIFVRVIAALADGLIIIIYVILLFLYSSFIDHLIPFHHYLEENYLLRHYISFTTLTVPVVFYFVISENSRIRGTTGKMWMNLKIESIYGEKPSVRALFVRNGLKFLPWEISHTVLLLYPEFLMTGEITGPVLVTGLLLSNGLLIIYIIMPLFRDDNRSFYELLSETRVVRKR